MGENPDYDDLISYLRQLYPLNPGDPVESLPTTIDSPWAGEGELTLRQAIKAVYADSVASRWLRRAMRRQTHE